MKKTIGRNLKILRENSGFTQEKVAEYLNVNRSAYANYEAGEREMPLDILEKAAALFGCELALFYEEDPELVQTELFCAFRANNLSDSDMHEVSAFKNIVLHYLKMERLLAK
jgi:transcriptional regulator with XRE-family HTH domain